jgi:hypothetical protein
MPIFDHTNPDTVHSLAFDPQIRFVCLQDFETEDIHRTIFLQ